MDKRGTNANNDILFLDDPVFSFIFFFLQTTSNVTSVAAIEKIELRAALSAIDGTMSEGMKAAADITHIIATPRSKRQFLSVKPADANPLFDNAIAAIDSAIIRMWLKKFQ
jgi:hypothetical protein